MKRSISVIDENLVDELNFVILSQLRELPGSTFVVLTGDTSTLTLPANKLTGSKIVALLIKIDSYFHFPFLV